MSPQNFVTSENFRPFANGGIKKCRLVLGTKYDWLGFSERRKQLVNSGIRFLSLKCDFFQISKHFK